MSETTVKELVFGEFQFHNMTRENCDEILVVLVKGFDPELDSVKRKRADAYAICKRLGLKSMADVTGYAEKEKQEKMKGTPADVIALEGNRAKLESLLKKSGARVAFDKYSDPDDNWRLCILLGKRLADKHNGISVAELEALEIASGEGRGIPIEFDNLESVPTTAPNGVPEITLQWFREEFERAAARQEAAPKIGRNQGKHAYASVLRTTGERLYMSLPAEYSYFDK